MGLKFNEICTRLESWFEGSRGKYLLAQERTLTDQLLKNVFGYHQLQIGVTRNQALGNGSELGHKIYCSAIGGGDVGLQSEPDVLPFASDSIDAVVLHHALEFSPRPHALLREVHRVLAPQGHLVVVGFNPASLFGLSIRAAGLLPDRLWSASHTIGTRRLKDWLNLLGADVQAVQHCFVTPPAGGQRVFRALSRCDELAMKYQLPVGGVYAVRAQKKVSTLTPSRIRWRKQLGPRLIGLSVPKPVASPCKGNVAA